MLLLNARQALQKEIPTLSIEKSEVCQKRYMYSCAHNHQRRKPLRSSGACHPGKKFNIRAPKMSFPAFWDHSKWKIVAFLTDSGSQGQLVPITVVHYWAKGYRRLMLGYQKGKNGKRKHYLSLGRKSFKSQENIKRKREARNICWKQEVSRGKQKVSCQNRRVGILVQTRFQQQICEAFILALKKLLSSSALWTKVTKTIKKDHNVYL